MSDITPQPPSSFFHITERDILAELLADKRSENTRRAYAKDLKDFFQSATGHEPSPQLITEFLQLERFTAIALVLQYKAALIEKGLAEATINRRLAAIKSLVKYAQKIGKCAWSLEEIEGERVSQYRDTTGIDQDAYSRLLAVCDRSTLLGKRNYAMLLLLWTNVLRRGEVVKCNCSDFSLELRTLQILGKGRGTQAEAVTLSAATAEAIATWLSARFNPLPITHYPPAEPLFCSLSNSSQGHRLTGNAVYNLVTETAIAAGIAKHMSPHRIRHSGITAALDATGGDVRRVQKLSRHKNVQTLLIYDDQRKNAQGEITDLLSGLVDDSEG